MEFRTVEKTDKNIMDRYFTAADHIGTDASFADIYCWREKYAYQISVSDGFCFIKGEDREPEGTLYFYHYPRGVGDVKAALEKIFADAEALGNTLIISSITEREAQEVMKLYPDKFTLFSDRDNSDYIYLTESLASLSGKKYHSKRNFIHRFTTLYPDWQVETVTKGNADECIELCKEWCAEDPDYENADDEIHAVSEAVSAFDEAEMFGLFLKVNGKAIAFSLGSPRNEEVFVTLFEKCLRTYPEGYAVINNEMAKALTRYKYVNREEDLGIEGLRKAKLSYRPAFLLDKYYVVEKN